MTAPKPSRISLRKDLYDFYIKESETVHALCDRAEIPDHLDGAPLSMSQRVGILESAYQGAVKQITGKYKVNQQ